MQWSSQSENIFCMSQVLPPPDQSPALVSLGEDDPLSAAPIYFSTDGTYLSDVGSYETASCGLAPRVVDPVLLKSVKQVRVGRGGLSWHCEVEKGRGELWRLALRLPALPAYWNLCPCNCKYGIPWEERLQETKDCKGKAVLACFALKFPRSESLTCTRNRTSALVPLQSDFVAYIPNPRYRREAPPGASARAAAPLRSRRVEPRPEEPDPEAARAERARRRAAAGGIVLPGRYRRVAIRQVWGAGAESAGVVAAGSWRLAAPLAACVVTHTCNSRPQLLSFLC